MPQPDTLHLLEPLETEAVTLLAHASMHSSPRDALAAIQDHRAEIDRLVSELLAIPMDSVADTLGRLIPALLCEAASVKDFQTHAAAIRALHVLASYPRFVLDLCEINAMPGTAKKVRYVHFRHAKTSEDIGMRGQPGWIPRLGRRYAGAALDMREADIDLEAYRKFLATKAHVWAADWSGPMQRLERIGFAGGVTADHAASGSAPRELLLDGRNVRIRRGKEFTLNVFGYDPDRKLGVDVTVAAICLILDTHRDCVLRVALADAIPCADTDPE